MRTFSWGLAALACAALLVGPTVAATPTLDDFIVGLPDNTQGTEDEVDRVVGAVDWVVRETDAFLKAVRKEVQRCLDPSGPGC